MREKTRAQKHWGERLERVEDIATSGKRQNAKTEGWARGQGKGVSRVRFQGTHSLHIQAQIGSLLRASAEP